MNPLYEVLKRPSDSPAPLPDPRLFECKYGELKSVKPGDVVTFSVTAVVKSADDEGKCTVNILKVNQGSEHQNDGIIRVRTQESHVG